MTPHTPWRLYWILEEKKNWIRFFGTCARKQKKGLTRARSKKKKNTSSLCCIYEIFLPSSNLIKIHPFFRFKQELHVRRGPVQPLYFPTKVAATGICSPLLFFSISWVQKKMNWLSSAVARNGRWGEKWQRVFFFPLKRKNRPTSNGHRINPKLLLAPTMATTQEDGKSGGGRWRTKKMVESFIQLEIRWI